MIDSTQYFTKKLVFFAVLWHTFRLKLKNWKKITLKIYLYLWKRNFLPAILENFMKQKPWKKFLIFPYMLYYQNSFYICSKEILSYIFTKENFSHISENRNLCFLSPSPKNKKNYTKKKFFVFQEMELSSSHIKKSHFSRN